MGDTSLFYYNDQLLKVNPRVLLLEYKITAAVTASPIISNSASLITFGAFASQAVIDDFLGTVDEFTLAQFDATAMGADAFGGLVQMNGQAAVISQMIARCYSNTGGADLVTRQVQGGTLTASTLETAVEVGADGNIGFKVDFGNTPDFDALTSGTIQIEIHWVPK